MRTRLLAVLSTLQLLACGGSNGNGGDGDAGPGGADSGPCEGLECFQVSCPGGGTTSVSGVVHAPNGTLPLYNVTVYVPRTEVGPLPEGATCDRCGSALSGNPLVQTTTDTMGRFTLGNMPATDGVPLVLQVGKWRRQITIPSVPSCEDTALDAEDTRLPRNQSEGDIPLMALTTGGADALECLLRKIGLDDEEFTTGLGDGRVHLYAGRQGTDEFDSQHGGGTFIPARDLWEDQEQLERYDVVFLSCEGTQDTGNKPAAALEAMKGYADLGGRVFASHWHNYWLQAGPEPWPDVLTFEFQDDLNNIEADVNTGFPRGADLADWLLHVGASTTLGRIAITAAQHTVTAVDEALAERWIYQDQTDNGTPSVQYMAFTTPIELAEEARCGRVVFSDIHVSSGDDSGADLQFPGGGCTSDIEELSPQEKVLAFMIFDIASCVGPDVE